jgi:hypothetical protein
MSQSKAPYTQRNSPGKELQSMMECKSMKVPSTAEIHTIQYAKA